MFLEPKIKCKINSFSTNLLKKAIKNRVEKKHRTIIPSYKSAKFYMIESFGNKTIFSDGMFVRPDKRLTSFTYRKFLKSSPDEKYAPLHNHSDLSLLDGASKISEISAFAKELELKSLSITDHGVMHAVVDLFKECEKLNIKPIAGNEMYVINGSIARNYKKSQLSKYHQIVLALSEGGYRNLVKLTTLSHLNGWQGSGAFGRPCISKRLLFKYKKDLVFTSACLGGEVGQNLLDKNFNFAKKVAEWYKITFNNFFFLELQDHGHREDRAVNMNILKIAKNIEVELLSTNDSHFTRDRDVEAHDTLLCIQTGKSFNEPGRMRYSGTEFLKSPDEMNKMYQDHVPEEMIDSALKNTILVSNQAKKYSIWAEITIPTFEMPFEYRNFSFDEFLEFLGFRGLDSLIKRKFTHKAQLHKFENRYEENYFKLKYKKYYQRLSYELESIRKMGFSTYFLVVWDFIDFARRNDVPIGSGRGSVAGSLVAYALGITNIDPMEHGLLFERFLNPNRKSMPDIDTDFSIDGRDIVIDYVSMKYGQEKVAQIITFNRLTSKSVLKDMGKSSLKENTIIDKMSESIPISRGKPLNLQAMISENSPSLEFRKDYLKSNHVKNMIDKALNFEGMNKTTAVHAAGVVISSKKLDKVVPLTRGIRGEVMTQYPMEDIEYLGLLKMDFLGLKNLSMVETVVNFVNYRFKSKILSLDSSHLQPHFDKNTYSLLARGDLDGIFQLDASLGMKDIVSEIRPNSIQDISSILALYRPGPLDTGLIPRFIKRKRKTLLYKFDYPELKNNLDETYGILLYQEQIMKVAQELAGFNMSQADILRRAMGKKKISEMKTQKKIFIEGCLNNSFEKIAGEKIFNQMVGFAEYCFNKSHSIAYSYTTYQTAWLKSHWPVEFFSSLMSANLTDFEKIEKFIYQAASIGIFLRKPEINTCDVFFVPDYSRCNELYISFGLGSIKNIGEIAASIIIADRKIFGGYSNLNEIVDRLISSQLITKKLVEILIIYGCLDKIVGGKKRKNILINLDKIIEWNNRTQKIKYVNQPLFLNLGSLKNENNDQPKKKKTNASLKNFRADLNLEQIYLSASLTGTSGINSWLLNYSEITLLLGTANNFIFSSIENENKNLSYSSVVVSKKRSFLTLGTIEKKRIMKNDNFTNDVPLIGVVLERQEYKTLFQKKIVKLILEDLNGVAIGIIFESSRNINETKIKKFENRTYSEFFVGDFILGSGVPYEEISGIRKFNLSYVAPVQGYKIFVIELSPQSLQCLSIHLLIRLHSVLNPHLSRNDEEGIPIIINIKGTKRNEILKTELSISKLNFHIISELFKNLGFKCKLFVFELSL